jgi:hypothetical protein
VTIGQRYVSLRRGVDNAPPFVDFELVRWSTDLHHASRATTCQQRARVKSAHQCILRLDIEVDAIGVLPMVHHGGFGQDLSFMKRLPPLLGICSSVGWRNKNVGS